MTDPKVLYFYSETMQGGCEPRDSANEGRGGK